MILAAYIFLYLPLKPFRSRRNVQLDFHGIQLSAHDEGGLTGRPPSGNFFGDVMTGAIGDAFLAGIRCNFLITRERRGIPLSSHFLPDVALPLPLVCPPARQAFRRPGKVRLEGGNSSTGKLTPSPFSGNGEATGEPVGSFRMGDPDFPAFESAGRACCRFQRQKALIRFRR